MRILLVILALLLIPAVAKADATNYTINGVPVATTVIDNDGTASANSNFFGIHLNHRPGRLSGTRNNCIGVQRCTNTSRIGSHKSDYVSLNK